MQAVQLAACSSKQRLPPQLKPTDMRQMLPLHPANHRVPAASWQPAAAHVNGLLLAIGLNHSHTQQRSLQRHPHSNTWNTMGAARPHLKSCAKPPKAARTDSKATRERKKERYPPCVAAPAPALYVTPHPDNCWIAPLAATRMVVILCRNPPHPSRPPPFVSLLLC